MVATSDQIAFRYVVEGSYGAGAAGAKMQDMRIVSESLGQDQKTRRSAVLRDDRQIEDDKRVNRNTSGSIETEVTYDTQHHDFFMYAVGDSAYSSKVTNTDTSYSMSDVDNSINDSNSQFVVDGFVADQWIKTSGFTTAANNVYFKIVSVAAGKMVLEGNSVTTEAAGDSVTIQMGAQAVNGVSLSSLAIEREYTDTATEFVEYQGQVIEGFTLSLNEKDVVTCSFDLMGEIEASGTATAGDGSPTAAATTLAFSTQEDVQTVWEGLSSTSAIMASLTVKNNIRLRDNILGTLGPDSAGAGKFEVSGDFRKLYTSKTLMDKYLNFTDTSIAFCFEDPAGNAYLFEVVECNYSNGRRVAGGENEDIIADMSFQAHRDATEDVTLRIVKFDA